MIILKVKLILLKEVHVFLNGMAQHIKIHQATNISLGLNSNRNFKGKSLARASTDKSPAIIEYPGIINSLDGGQSKDDLIPGS